MVYLIKDIIIFVYKFFKLFADRCEVIFLVSRINLFYKQHKRKKVGWFKIPFNLFPDEQDGISLRGGAHL